MHFQAHDVAVFVFCSAPASDPGRCLDGLLTQTVTPGKVVIVDNAIDIPVTLDPFIAASFATPPDLLRSPETMTEGDLRNLALKTCSAKIFASLDADQIPAPDWLELMLLSMASPCQCLTPASGVIAGIGGMTAWLIPPPSMKAETINCGDQPQRDPEFIQCGNCILRTDLLDKIGGFGSGLSGVELWRDLAARLRTAGGTLLYMPDIRCGRF